MKFFANVLLVLLGAVFVAAAPSNKEVLPITSRFTPQQLASLRARVRGCNANVCFAIDGSGSISAANFNAQKQFVQDVASVIATGTNPVELAAVQYGTSASVISELTVDAGKFIWDVEATEPLRSPATFVAAGINFCFSRLFRRRHEAKKIVLLGDGRSNIGSSAVRRADTFRRFKGEVCTVGAGFTDDRELLAIAGGDASRVFEVEEFLDVLSIEKIIEDIVLDICSH